MPATMALKVENLLGEKQFEIRRTTLSRAPALTGAAYLMIKQKMDGGL
jgi:hypothetical protein